VAQAIYQQVLGTGIATAIILDNAQTPFNASFAVELLAGTASFGVQFTLDDLNSASGTALPLPGQSVNTTVTWFNDVNAPAGSTTSVVGNYMFPIRALRVNVASGGPTTVLQFAVLQGYPTSG
jgi:hypothetical protein